MPKTTTSSVDLVPHDPSWAALAITEGDRLCQTLGGILITVHHIGSTAIPDIYAKPILDLMPVVVSIERLEDYREVFASLGYDWRGEFGLPGRRYCRNDPATGRRLVNAHCYQQGSTEIDRHLAFRDYLRDHPDLARAYEQEKQRCRTLHADDIATYTDCKDGWIRRVEAKALLWKNGQPESAIRAPDVAAAAVTSVVIVFKTIQPIQNGMDANPAFLCYGRAYAFPQREVIDEGLYRRRVRKARTVYGAARAGSRPRGRWRLP